MAQYGNQRRRRRPRLGRLLVFLALLFIIGTLLNNIFFSVQSVTVRGNSYVTAEQVVDASGIKRGDSIFTLNTRSIREGINDNRYLEFVGLWRSFFPPAVTLTVSEHTPRVKMAWMGMLVIIGDNGVVLEQTSQIDREVHVPEVIGMTASQVRIGQPVAYGVAGQGEAIDRIISAMELQGIGGVIAQINIASPDSLFLVTEDGLQISLGNDDNLAVKFALVREVLPRIQTLGSVEGGMLDVSTGKAADYRPPK